ncbi:homogentisate 1,2-dioxygenase [Hyalangium minutum]|uniref:Homogentisate 1,2-dioxygenase n=1 Tax=Hyalangium minutum TaxID=394096 RepID=A0A085W4S8_9BACT|nr:homogentisate 1,2-dioxygenase [Hyalangium minutum]KFE62691.1 Homogentisate 1,2-dioxygenase [Hyalangium minutum]
MFERRVVGKVPRKHHLQLRDDKGTLMYEECITRDGFEGPYTIAYHQQAPHTQSLSQPGHGWKAPEAVTGRPLAKRHYRTQALQRVGGAPLDARVPLLFNADVTLAVVHPTAEDPVYFSNADGDDLFYIQEGSGVLRSPLGDLRFEAEDYVFVPRGLVHRLIPDKGVAQYWLSIECKGGLHLPRQWRNDVGQLRMDAPYCHRDFRLVEFSGPKDEGIRELVVKRGDVFHGFRNQHSPLDVVGWDGTVYPWAFPILNFQPRAGLVHLPPTWHGTFATRGALICSFVPRVVDFHPEAIPCPYPHSSVDCDEFLFYCRGDFISRKGVGPGSVSHHPMGVTHGPHPGAYENSIGHKTTDELAVMLDTTLPLHPTAAALSIEDPNYQNSFIP